MGSTSSTGFGAPKSGRVVELLEGGAGAEPVDADVALLEVELDALGVDAAALP
jgi:hypothetical protein